MSRHELRAPLDGFPHRHLGPRPADVIEMLAVVATPDLETLVAEAIPEVVRTTRPLDLPAPLGEHGVVAHLRAIAEQNEVKRSLIGMGYHDCFTPAVIARNVLEDPGWYTQYTPYQAEISQGRLEALLNFQTMVIELTGLPLANSSLLDEATAAAEAMVMCWAAARKKKAVFVVAAGCHPQTIAVVETRAKPLGIEVRVGVPSDLIAAGVFGVLLQYPETDGDVVDPRAVIEAAHGVGAMAVVAADPLALMLLESPGALGADIAVGSTQRFGVPLGYGGPHAGYMATIEKHKRLMPGRLIGVSKDADGQPALRLALQTREQHIRRDRATSNICTAQVLLAIMAGMYAVYHGPEGLKRIARHVHGLTGTLAAGLEGLGYALPATYFDTLKISVDDTESIHAAALDEGINLRRYAGDVVGVALDETCDLTVVEALLRVFARGQQTPDVETIVAREGLPEALRRAAPLLQHPVFNQYHAEHELLRYLTRLKSRDLSLAHAMIPLGSCTMKLNAAAEMQAISWPEFARMHPFAPAEQTKGYQRLFADLERWLAEITGFAAISLQPNAGSQGEYTGLMVIRAWQAARGEGGRNVCLIPTSAHGTNPASAVLAGFKVVTVTCDERGDIDLTDLEAKIEKHAATLAAMMLTYPSTHGVFEEGVKRACEMVHAAGGQVYLDGANMNAQVGLCRPGEIGADVCHLNLHKTFAIPHGGGGPGVGPIGVAAHLAKYLPGHPVTDRDRPDAIGPVSAAAYGSASVLPITYAYLAMMGGEGLTEASRIAILNANYMASRLKGAYDILYTGANGRVAHEFILDCRGFKGSAGIEVEDIAKRLMDYGFHAPTMSWPVAGTLMVEPTESESKAELDRFCEAMLAIRAEIAAIERGEMDRVDNPLKRSPHPVGVVCADVWDRPYTRAQAAFPLPWVRARKFWPHTARIDNAYGDRNLFCSCTPVDHSEGDL